MYRLIGINKKNDTDSQSIYEYETLEEVRAEYETKLGASMKTNDAGFYVILDDIASIIISEKFGETEITPRLIDIKTEADGSVTANAAKYDTAELVKANYHSKLGSAMKKLDEVRFIVLRGFNGKGESIIYGTHTNPVPQPEPEPTPSEEELEVVEPTEPTEPTE